MTPKNSEQGKHRPSPTTLPGMILQKERNTSLRAEQSACRSHSPFSRAFMECLHLGSQTMLFFSSKQGEEGQN